MQARPTRTVSTRFWFRPELTPQRLPTQTATARPPRLPSPTVTITSGGTTTQNFTMVGTSNLQENSVTIDDATSGNGNGVINRNECVNLNIALKNNGCANATGISATLTTSTPGVTVMQGSSSYPDMPIDVIGTNSTPFQIQTSSLIRLRNGDRV